MTLTELTAPRSRLQSILLGLNNYMTMDDIRWQMRDHPDLNPPERVWLLTQPGLAVKFNPVNFYLCLTGNAISALLAEVTNTPWGERFCYVLVPQFASPNVYRGTYKKAFHVSPFLPMNLDYEWSLSIEDNLRITMRSSTFAATVNLARQPLTNKALVRLTLRRPLQNLSTLIKIYWQALHLWRKGAQFHAHPNR